MQQRSQIRNAFVRFLATWIDAGGKLNKKCEHLGTDAHILITNQLQYGNRNQHATLLP